MQKRMLKDTRSAGLEYETVMEALVGLEEADHEEREWRDRVDGILQYKQETHVYAACIACDEWTAERKTKEERS